MAGVRCRDASGKGETPIADDIGEVAYLMQSEKSTTPRGWLGNLLDNSLLFAGGDLLFSSWSSAAKSVADAGRKITSLIHASAILYGNGGNNLRCVNGYVF